MSCELRSLRSTDQRRLVADVAAQLRQGLLCVLPTETVYGLAVLPSHAGAVARARALKGRDDAQPFTWHLARREDMAQFVTAVPKSIGRLLDRYWPGPLTVVLQTAHGGTAGMRVPAHAFTRQVIATTGEPLWLSSCNRATEPPLLEAGVIAARYAAEVSLVVDDGPSPLGVASSIVRQVGPKLEILREGILTAAEIMRTAADLVLFVCTGNTCRSPLAEALARDLCRRSLGVPSGDVLAYGLDFASAGTGTVPDLPASEGSVAAAAELDIDLTAHSSRQIDHELVARATHIVCLGQSHRRAILAEVPGAADKVILLRPDGLDVADPFGCDLKTYRRVRDEIRAAIGARLPMWLAVQNP